MGHTELFQQLFHTFQTRAVQRGVDELERVDARAVADALVIDSLHKIIEAFFVNCHNAARRRQRQNLPAGHRQSNQFFSIAARIFSAASSVIWQPSAP